ncbi:MAG: creatininase, partial [Clostridiales bacterium]|nr:creatininase [Clostridiales bacterium]
CLQLQGHGFRRFIILNGHGGNCKSIECTGMKLYEKGCLLCRVDWWILAGQLNEAWRGGHGGAEEARGVMAWDEDLIKKEHLYTGESTQNDLGDELPYASWTAVSFDGGTVTVPRPVRSFTDNGWLAHGIENDEPFKATPEEGRKMLTRVAKYVADLCGVFGKAPLPAAEKE